MGGGKGSSGPSEAVQEGELANSTALTRIAEQQASNSRQLYNLTEPGLAQSENFYQTLAAGDPAAIMRAVAPTAQAASQTTASSNANILANTPNGGQKNLALAQNQANQGAEIAKTVSSATTGSYNALGQLAGQGVGESISAGGAATSAYGTANQGLGTLGQQQIETQQMQAQEKGNVLGSATGLAQDATMLAFL